MALLPVVAARRWHLGASGYGVSVAAVGLGAVLAVTVAGLIRLRLSDNLQLAASAAAYGVAIVAVAWLPFAAALPFLVISGMAWLITLTTLNAAAQLTLPRWVRARGLSVYLLVATGSQAIGSYVWGAFATRAGVDVALLGSAVGLGVTSTTSLCVCPDEFCDQVIGPGGPSWSAGPCRSSCIHATSCQLPCFHSTRR
ncbi:MAG: hypothetical protein QOD88_4638 [Mycobacterium sp.]|nr:hypothetical protein [Mycobacterium sp.]